MGGGRGLLVRRRQDARGGRHGHGGSGELRKAPAASTSPAASVKITQAAVNEDADGARLVLSSNAPLLYTSYEPRPDLLIVDLRDASVGLGLPDRRRLRAVSWNRSSSKSSTSSAGASRACRSRTSADAKPDVRSVGQGLAIAFSGPATASAEEAPAPARLRQKLPPWPP